MRADHFLGPPFFCLPPQRPAVSKCRTAPVRRSNWPPFGYRLVGGGILRLSGVDLDATFELRAVLDANPRGGDVADDGAITLDVDAVAGMNIADYLSVDDNFSRVNL